ncbi:ParB N-terminal domain-containing protein [Cupriavidus sp. D384]|uniref:ParB/RepB/Spo0J family partition protein n=1 Tax=Cupriavidus sp. D384 TaxID=1538095 RepID=UPI000830AE30|nr:ParB N-terminal domain-containing protein [Cupriavidus sp. D384]
MRIGDKLLAKTANIAVKTSPPKPDANEPKTSPGRMLAAQSAVAAAERRVAELEANVGKAVEVALDEIAEVPGRRRKLTPEQYAELRENLRNNKLVHPITLVVRGDGKKELVAGHNRFYVFRELGRDAIPAVFADLADVEQIEEAAFYSNLLSPSLPDFEKYLGFQKHVDRTGQSQQDIAAAAGISAGHLSKLFSYARLPGSAIAALEAASDRGRLGVNAAYEMATFLGEHPDQEAAVTEVVEKLLSDEKVTQKQAIALLHARVRQKTAAPAAAETHRIKVGTRELCAVTTRNGTVTLKFKKAEDAQAWEKRVREFIEANAGTNH